LVVDGSSEDLEPLLELMSEPIPWAPGLVLKGDGFTCDFYRKE